MNQFRKHAIAFLGGFVVMQVLIVGVEALGHMIAPPPEACQGYMRMMTEAGAMEACMEALVDYLPTAPLMAWLSPMIAWFAGVLGGGLVAARLAPSHAHRHIWVLAALTFAGAVFNLAALPSTIAMWALGLLAPVAGAWLALKKSRA